ncbi:hypothetical protein [Jiangella gansuensis]|uniref:hypothetical protein n=1 Tax=Jiangella gansuensis TaxID=281473 RepID=UPI0004ADFE16|nr:hypothetical protein [Jiangella gansuensis]
MTPRSAILLAAPLLLAMGACAGSQGDDDVAVPADPAPAARAANSVASPPAGTLVLPLDAYAFSAAEDQVLGQAAEAAVIACFEARGFDAADAHPLPFTRAVADDASARHERRYSVTDPDVAARHGYHPPDTTDVREEFYASHTEPELAALVGSGDGAPDGCLHQAEAATTAGDEAALRAGEELVSEVQADAWHGAMADPRVVEAFRAWSACMAEAGYRYDAPMDANDDPTWWRTDTASAEEIATATADVACKESTGLIPVWSEVEAEYQAELIAQHQDRFDAYRARLDEQVAQARAELR